VHGCLECCALISEHNLTLRVEARSWEHHDGTSDKCGLQAIQDEKHALFLCPCMQMCMSRLQFADLFQDLPQAHKITVNQTEAFYFSQARSGMSSLFSRNKLMIPIVLSQSLWMSSVWLVFSSNLHSQTIWLKFKLKLVNLISEHNITNLEQCLLFVCHARLVSLPIQYHYPFAGSWLVDICCCHSHGDWISLFD